MDAHRLERLAELRADAGRLEPALDLAVDDAGLLEHEHVLHDDRVALHALDLGDVHDLSRAILEAGLVEDHVDRGADLLADGPYRQGDAGPEGHPPAAGRAVA